MAKLTQKKLLERFKTMESNFLRLANNQELKKVVSDMKKLKKKRQDQVEEMLNSTWPEVKKSYNKEVKNIENFFKSEIDKTKKVFKKQLSEMEKLKETLGCLSQKVIEKPSD